MLYCRDIWARRSGYATEAVTVGVIAEAFEVTFGLYWYLRQGWSKAFMQSIAPKKKEPEWFAIVGALGLLFVIIGVAGEWQFDEKLSDANATVANFDHRQTVEAGNQAEAAKRAAGDAVKSAETAKVIADAAGAVAASAEISAGNASALASTASESARIVGNKADQLGVRLNAANTELAELKAKRKATEAYLHNVAVCTAPRVIQELIIGGPDGGTSADGLIPIRGFTVNIVVVDDQEAQVAALQLEGALKLARVNFSRVEISPRENVAAGVTVESFGLANDPDRFPPRSDRPSQEAAWALIRFLHSFNWQAGWRDGPSSDTRDLNPTSIRVAIGRYPTPVLAPPPALETLSAKAAKLEKDFNDEFDAKGDRDLAERIKGQSPEIAKAMQDAHENFKRSEPREMKQMLEKEGGVQPCKIIATQ